MGTRNLRLLWTAGSAVGAVLGCILLAHVLLPGPGPTLLREAPAPEPSQRAGVVPPAPAPLEETAVSVRWNFDDVAAPALTARFEEGPCRKPGLSKWQEPIPLQGAWEGCLPVRRIRAGLFSTFPVVAESEAGDLVAEGHTVGVTYFDESGYRRLAITVAWVCPGSVAAPDPAVCTPLISVEPDVPLGGAPTGDYEGEPFTFEVQPLERDPRVDPGYEEL